MSLEQRLINQYRKDANIADMGGYGLSGGNDNVLDEYQHQLMNTLNTSIPRSGPLGSGLASHGGRKRGRPRGSKNKSSKSKGGFFPGAAMLAPAAIALISKLISGKGLSGGEMSMLSRIAPNDIANGIKLEQKGSPSIGYPSKYPGSFPMPGFFPGPQESYGQGYPVSGQGLSGGRKARASRGPSSNPWLKRVADYRKSHGVSQKEAMIALKGT